MSDRITGKKCNFCDKPAVAELTIDEGKKRHLFRFKKEIQDSVFLCQTHYAEIKKA